MLRGSEIAERAKGTDLMRRWKAGLEEGTERFCVRLRLGKFASTVRIGGQGDGRPGLCASTRQIGSGVRDDAAELGACRGLVVHEQPSFGGDAVAFEGATSLECTVADRGKAKKTSDVLCGVGFRVDVSDDVFGFEAVLGVDRVRVDRNVVGPLPCHGGLGLGREWRPDQERRGCGCGRDAKPDRLVAPRRFLQRGMKRCGGWPALAWVRCQPPQQHLAKPRRKGAQLGRIRTAELRLGERVHALGEERGLAKQSDPKRTAKRIDVGDDRGRLTTQDFWGHEGWGARRLDALSLFGDRLGQPKVGEQRRSVLSYEDVRRLDVAMQQSPAMHFGEATTKRARGRDDGVDRTSLRPCIKG